MAAEASEDLYRELKPLLINPRVGRDGNIDSFCPIHEGDGRHKRRSLSLHPTKGLTCWAGCDFKQILDALRGAQARPSQSRPGKVTAWSEPVAVYNYVTSDGVAAEKGRFEDGRSKRFLWRVPPAGWKDGLGGLTVADMRLWHDEDLLADAASPVFFCEGEKATEACRERGLLAVCLAGSASQRDFGIALAGLAGREVVLWPDNDGVGRDFMQAVGAALDGVAQRVRWLSVDGLPDKGDAADFFAAGRGLVEVRALLDAAPDFEAKAATRADGAGRKFYTWDELLDAEFPPTEWLLDGILPRVGLTILGGRPKIGKSWLALQLAGAIGTGDEVLQRRARAARVLYYCLEDREARTRDRAQRQEWPRGATVTFTAGLSPLDEEGMAQLKGDLAAHPSEVVVIDTLAAVKTAKSDENAAGPMADLVNGLQRLAHDAGIAILLIAHHRKGGTQDPTDDLRGSSAIAGAADQILGLYKDHERIHLSVSGRDTEDATYRMEFEEYRWKLKGDERVLFEQESEREVTDALRSLGESDAGAIARALGWTRPTTLRHLRRLEQDREVESRAVISYGEGGTKKIVFRLSGPHSSEQGGYWNE